MGIEEFSGGMPTEVSSVPTGIASMPLARPTREPNRAVGQECHLMGGVSRDRVRLSEIIFFKNYLYVIPRAKF